MKKQILIVDDDPGFVDSIEQLLEANSYKVERAASGAEGFIKAKEIRPDLIIIDVMMESWDAGLDLVTKLQEEEKTKNIPRILLTAVSIQSPLEPMASPDALGVRSILQKPIKPDEFLKTIRRALGEEADH